MGDIPVVVDVSVCADAVLAGDDLPAVWPDVPPVTQNAAADCVGVLSNGRELSLWLSPHILTNTLRVVAAAGFADDTARDYIAVLSDIAFASGGGWLTLLDQYTTAPATRATWPSTWPPTSAP